MNSTAYAKGNNAGAIASNARFSPNTLTHKTNSTMANLKYSIANLKYVVRTLDPTGIYELNPEDAYHATDLDDAKQHLLDLTSNGKVAVITCHNEDGRDVGTIYRTTDHRWIKRSHL